MTSQQVIAISDPDAYARLNARGIEGITTYMGRSKAALAVDAGIPRFTLSAHEQAVGRQTRAERIARFKREQGASIDEHRARQAGWERCKATWAARRAMTGQPHSVTDRAAYHRWHRQQVRAKIEAERRGSRGQPCSE